MRIASLSPSLSETLQSLGLSEDLVAVTDQCPKILGSPVRVGPSGALDLEKIRQTKPELVLADFFENRPEQLRELERKTCRVSRFQVVSLPSLIQAIHEIGDLTARQEEAKNLIRKIYEVWQQAPKDPVRTVIMVWKNPVTTVSAKTYASHLVEAAGGFNLFREDPTAEVAVEFEDVLEKKPELLLLPGTPFAFHEKDRDYYKGFPDLLKTQVQWIDGSFFARYGPSTVNALKNLRELMRQVRDL